MMDEDENINSIGQNGVPFPKNYGGIGYIYIPSDVERQKFISTCYNITKVSFVTEDGQIYHNVPIDKVAIKEVIFPSDDRKLGSPIVWMNIPFKDSPVVIGVYNALDEFQKLEEDQFALEKITSTGMVKISGKGKTGELFIYVNNFSSTGNTLDLQDDQLESLPSRQQIEGGKIFIDVQNDGGTAEVNLNVKGKINIVTEDTTYIKNANEFLLEVRDEELDPNNGLTNVTTKISFKNGILDFKIVTLDDQGNETKDGIIELNYTRGTGLNYVDEFNNQIITNKDQVQITSKKFLLNGGAEAMLLGNTWKKLMDNFIDTVSQITVTTSEGPSGPPINVADIIAFKEQTQNVLSQLGFLDSKDSS